MSHVELFKYQMEYYFFCDSYSTILVTGGKSKKGVTLMRNKLFDALGTVASICTIIMFVDFLMKLV